MSGPAARGRDFEKEVAGFLREAGFEVTLDPAVARPRQTDLYAKADGIELLIEAKNQQRKVDVSDIDDIRARLNRAPTDIVGVIFTTSGFTKGALRAIEQNRTREVLAFAKEEVEGLRERTKNFLTLVERKRSEIRTHGKVWFAGRVQSEFSHVELPRSTIEFRFGELTSCYFESASSLSAAFYSLNIRDTGWGLMAGEGARLSMQPDLHRVADARDLLGYLHEKFGLSSNGWFSIHQSECSWYGTGIDNCLDAIGDWRERYTKSPFDRFHHSEQIIYVDELRNGWIELSFQQRVECDRDSSFLHNSGLTIQLPGIPVDSSPYLKLCQYLRNNGASFQYLAERYTHLVRLKKPVALNPRGTIVRRARHSGDYAQERVVIGLVAANPFYQQKSLLPELENTAQETLNELLETELLVCSLRDWHDEEDKGERYLLEGFEITLGDHGQIIRAFGTWNRLLD